MKIILLQDVYKKGVAGEVVNVAAGYARNYLIPQRIAIKASEGALRQHENLRKKSDVRRAERDKEYEIIAEKINGIELYFPVKAGDSGKLYGSVTSGDIASELKSQIGLDIDKRRLGDKALRELGSFDVPVRLEAGLSPTVKVFLFREDEDPREVEEEEVVEEADEMFEEADETTEAVAEDMAEATDELVEEEAINEPVAEDESDTEDESDAD